MSGDVQPRKRKDKKKKKDELGGEEPRGTAAALGEGDVFIHSQHDHGTGGHWCAKIIFFSLLAVLITLIGLIILENRGLTELEANAVESQYSGILEGWIEDAPNDDHHDEHTLDLKDHDEGEDDHNGEELDHEDEEEHETDHEDEEDQETDHEDDDEDEDEDEDSHEENIDADEDEEDREESQEDPTEGEDDEEENESNEQDSDEEKEYDNDDKQTEENLEDDDDNEEVEEKAYNRYNYNEDDDEDNSHQNDDDHEELNEDDNDDDDDQNDENDYQNDENDDENDEDEQNDEDDERNYEDEDQSNEDGQYDIENDYSNEITNDEYNSNELRDNEDKTEQDDDTREENDEEIEKIEKEIVDDEVSEEDMSREAGDDDDDENDLPDQEDDDDEPPLERITAPPAGKPFVEIEEEIIEKPVNSLAEEEEYEKQQEQRRKEEEEEAAQGSQIWLKLAVGGALLVATHAVLRRATAPRDIPAPEEHAREETPTIDRRMTLVPEPPSPRVQQESPVTEIAREVEEVVFKKPAPVSVSSPIIKQDSEEEEEDEVILKNVPVQKIAPVADTKAEEKELYSDEDEEVEDEEEEEEEEDEEYIEEPVKETVQKKTAPVAEQKPTEDSEPEDVEIIDEEQIEEDEEEENEEEDVSDVDDTELLSRLEAKYGRLPEPERFGPKPERFGPKHSKQTCWKDGGNSIEDDWPGEPSDAYWRTELNIAEEELRQGAWSSCEKRVSAAALAGSGRARWLAARALDRAAEARRDNRLLARAVAAYLHLLKMNERISDKKLLRVAQRTIDRIQFRGTYLNAEPIYRLLIRRFPENVNFRNNLTVSFLMANRADLADEVLKETLLLWPNDRVALAHHGFVLKTQYNKLEEAVSVLYKALEGDTGPANEPRFYYHLGDALLLLGRFEEAHEVHKRGAALGHFLSPSQRSLYNVPRLKSRPWWPAEETPYVNLVRALERSWRDILKEGEAAKALYEKEKEGLKERGEWSQLDLFVRGAEIPGRCARAPRTCAVVRGEAAAAGCRRGQVKFSAMAAGTHVRPHVGPTNCRLRMHLGLSNTKDTYIRVDKETRQWQTGKAFIFDDSFEHEVWHNGTGSRLVLIVDVWHPELTAAERRTLPAI